jgi:hypothetical protein
LTYAHLLGAIDPRDLSRAAVRRPGDLRRRRGADLRAASGAAMALSGLSLVFGFSLGIVFSIGVVLLAARAAVL